MSVKMALLALLAEGPRHGYQLKIEFEGRTGGVWPLNVGQVYTTLGRLERDGLVTPTANGTGPGRDNRNQRAFAITDQGREELVSWMHVAEPGEIPRDELLVKVLVALAEPHAALDVVTAQRTALFGQLQALRRAAPTTDVAAVLVHDAMAVRVEADLRWLDRCEARLREQLGAPLDDKEREWTRR